MDRIKTKGKRKTKTKDKRIFGTCSYCLRSSKDFRSPELYPLVEVIDPLDKNNRIYAHKQCIVDCSYTYRENMQLLNEVKQLFRKLLT